MCPCYSLQVILYSLNGTEIRERMYENTWKSGELELYFPPSAEGLEEKIKILSSCSHACAVYLLLPRIILYVCSRVIPR